MVSIAAKLQDVSGFYIGAACVNEIESSRYFQCSHSFHTDKVLLQKIMIQRSISFKLKRAHSFKQFQASIYIQTE